MEYGITDPSQIIDANEIRKGCENFKKTLDDFQKCGEKVVQAGEKCDEKALSIDEKTLQYSITDLGEEIKRLKTTYTEYANQVIEAAANIYNKQVEEYNNYLNESTKK